MPTSKFTQDNRMLQLETPLGKDVLLMNKMVVEEGISQLYSIEAEVLHEEKEGWKIPEPIDYTKILGQEVSLLITQDENANEGRSYSGIVSEFTLGWRSERFSIYKMRIVPNVWAYTQNSQCRIFQQKTVVSIIKEVFADIENLIVWETEYDYKPRNYCVQYRETDFDFASRLMEEEGIYYYFEHADGSHKMVISDRPQFSRTCPGRGELHFIDTADSERFSATIIREWGTDFKIGPGLFSFRDHHIQQPNKKLATSSTSKYSSGESSSWEIYDYPGGYARKYDGIDPGGGKVSDLDNIIPDGKKTAQVASEILDAGFKTVKAKSDCSSLTSGHLFKINDHPMKDENGQYVITSIRHRAVQSPAYDRDDTTYDEEQAEDPYSNEFKALAHARKGAVPFRPEQKTAKPIVHGAQTAVVVGTSGEEIYTDEYGRIKVQFHWDRDGRTDGSDSCWLPVAQTWAGNGWGSMFIPRVGMEVIVHFLEGDADQPIVSGCVYNPANMPPYKLPEEKTKSTIKTDSSKGGNGFNELRFEDKKGEEQIFIHGEKNLDVRIKNDRLEWTGRDQHLIVIEDLVEKVGDSKGSHHLEVKDDQKIKIGGEHHLKVGSNENIEVGGTQAVKISGSQGINVTGGHSTEAGGAMYLKGMAVVVEGMTQLTLKVGGNFVDINPGGVFIQGTMVMINSGGAPGTGMAVGPCPPTAPDEPVVADDAKPGSKMRVEKQTNERQKKKSSKEDPTKTSWIKIAMNYEDGSPAAGESYQIVTSDGKTKGGSLNNEGKAHVKMIEPGNCKVTFPNLDKDAWEDA